MKDRIKIIRKKYDLTQTEFGERIGVKGNTVTGYETGLRTPSGIVIKAICDCFDVNEKWLRYGEGKMDRPKTRNEQISDFMTKALKDENESFRRRLIEAMAAWDEKDWEDAERLALKLTKKG